MTIPDTKAMSCVSTSAKIKIEMKFKHNLEDFGSIVLHRICIQRIQQQGTPWMQPTSLPALDRIPIFRSKRVCKESQASVRVVRIRRRIASHRCHNPPYGVLLVHVGW